MFKGFCRKTRKSQIRYREPSTSDPSQVISARWSQTGHQDALYDIITERSLLIGCLSAESSYRQNQ